MCTEFYLRVPGIYNYEEYLLVHEVDEMEREKTLSMRKSHQSATGTLRDADKMDKLRKELHTDDDGKFLQSLPLNSTPDIF